MRQETVDRRARTGTQAERIKAEWMKVQEKYFGDGNGGLITPKQASEKYQETRPNLKGEMYDEVEKVMKDDPYTPGVPRATIRRVVNSFDTYFVRANNKYQSVMVTE